MKTLFSVSVAVLALCGAGFGEAQVEQREQLLRSKLSPAQARALRQAVSAFEAQLDVPGSPEAALDNALAGAGVSGVDVSEAAFLVMDMATGDMDDDIATLAKEVEATNAAKQKLRDEIVALNGWIATQMEKSGSSQDIPVQGVAGVGGPGVQTGVVSMRTPCFKIEYWRFTPPEERDFRRMSMQELRAEALRLRLASVTLDELLFRMSAVVRRVTERRARFGQARERLLAKLPSPK